MIKKDNTGSSAIMGQITRKNPKSQESRKQATQVTSRKTVGRNTGVVALPKKAAAKKKK